MSTVRVEGPPARPRRRTAENNVTTDDQIKSKIEALIDEEHELRQAAADGGPTPAEHARMDDIKVELDQLWDWRRQRDALRSAGRDPDEAHERHASMVEHYLQ
jgi:hypothetical protein